MWAMPDAMSDMMESKVAHPRAGASTAWVPSPTAAVLHAMHYHEVSVADRQRELAPEVAGGFRGYPHASVAYGRVECRRDRKRVGQQCPGNSRVRFLNWVGQGIGCSKVPDINDVGLMEDRATLRICWSAYRKLVAPRPRRRSAGKGDFRSHGSGG